MRSGFGAIGGGIFLALAWATGVPGADLGRSTCRELRFEWVSFALEGERRDFEDPTPRFTAVAGALRRDLGMGSVSGLPAHQAELHDRIREGCQAYYEYRPSSFYRFETRDPRQPEEVLTSLKGKVSGYRREALLGECQRRTARLDRLRQEYASRLVAALDLEAQPDPNLPAAEARARLARAEEARAEARTRGQEALALVEAIERDCGTFGDGELAWFEQVRLALEVTHTVVPPPALAIRAAAEVASSKDEIRTCLDDTQGCLDDLDQAQEELGLLLDELEQLRFDLGDKRGEVERLSQEYVDTRARSRTHLYASPEGALFVAADGAGAGEGEQLGWLLCCGELDAARVARRFQREAREELEALEARALEVEGQVLDLRDHLERGLPACDDARYRCQRELVELEREKAGWLERLGDDGAIQEETSGFADAAIEVRRLVHRAVVRATRLLDEVTPIGQLEWIPELEDAAPLASWELARGWGPAHRRAAAETLGPHAGAHLALRDRVLLLDRGSLETLGEP